MHPAPGAGYGWDDHRRSLDGRCGSGSRAAHTGPATSKTVELDDAGGRGPVSFDPANLTFDPGETVDRAFAGESTVHTLTAADPGIDVYVAGGETVSFQYTFDTPGTYELICVPHQALGMVGTITVR